MASKTESLALVVKENLLKIARQRSGEIAQIEERQLLREDLGFNSLDLAQLVASLEMTLNVDPFAREASLPSVRTVGDLIQCYAHCFPDADGQ